MVPGWEVLSESYGDDSIVNGYNSWVTDCGSRLGEKGKNGKNEGRGLNETELARHGCLLSVKDP